MREHTITLPNGTTDVRTSTSRNPYRYAVIGGQHRLSILQFRLAEVRSYTERAEQYENDADQIRIGTFTAPSVDDYYGGSLVAFAEAAADRRPQTRGLRGRPAIEALAQSYDDLAAAQRRQAQRHYDAALAYDATGTDWYVISCHGTLAAAERAVRKQAAGTAKRSVAYDVVRIVELDDEQ